MKNTPNLNAIYEIRKGAISPYSIGYFKYSMSYLDQKTIFNVIDNSKRNILFSNPIPTKAEELCNGMISIHTSPSLIEEIRWYFNSIKLHSKIIKEYIKLKDQLEATILRADVGGTLDCLDKIEDSCGLSFFLLQSEIYINEIDSRQELNKDFLIELRDEGAKDKLLLTLEFSRSRIDKTLNIWQYDSLIEFHKKNYRANDKPIFEYINYKLDQFPYEQDFKFLPFIFHFESDFSITDRYDSLKKLLLISLSQISEEDKGYIIKEAKEIYKLTNDEFWHKILVLFGSTESLNESERSKRYQYVEKLFFNGHWEMVITECSKILNTNPNYSELYLFFIKSTIILGKDLSSFISPQTELYNILDLTSSILQKKSTYLSDRERLQKKYYEISHFDFSYFLLDIIYYEFKIEIPNLARLITFGFTYPIQYNFFHVISSGKQPKEILRYNSLNETFKFVRAANDDINSLNTLLAKQIFISYLLHQKEYSQVLNHLNAPSFNSDTLSEVTFVKTWLIKTKMKCLVKLEEYGSAARLIADYYFEQGNIYDHYLDEKLVISLLDKDGDEIYKEISIPIAFHLSNEPESALYDAVANFLVQHNCLIPSDLIAASSYIPINRMIYFFEHLCTKDIIESSPFLNSIEAVENERILILNHLKEINSLSEERYNEEILEITKISSIRKGLQHIHDSRIYVDITGIEKKIEAEIKEAFDRYLEFNDANYIDVTSITLNKALHQHEHSTVFYLKETVEASQLASYISNYSPAFDTNAVVVPFIRYVYFINLFNKISSAYVFDEDYGFKSFLSMRIRHGTFANVLRSVFDKSHLMSSKKTGGLDYNEITYWNEMDRISFENIGSIQELLIEFTKDIDGVIDSSLKLLNVKNNVNEIAAFDFYFNDMEMNVLFFNRLGKITSHKDFIHEIFNILFERLELCLERVRTSFLSDLNDIFIKKLDNLSRSIELLGHGNGILIDNIVTCRTEIQTTMQQVNWWFKISKSQYVEKFDISVILETSRTYIDIIHGKALSRAKINIRNSFFENFKGKYFEYFGDIFINIFDNILKYNKELDEDLTIDIDISKYGEYIIVSVKNNLANNNNIADLQSTINDIKMAIQNYKNGTPISYEHGSGFPKICKCIAVDLNRDQYNIDPICNGNTFEIKIQFKYENLLA